MSLPGLLKNLWLWESFTHLLKKNNPAGHSLSLNFCNILGNQFLRTSLKVEDLASQISFTWSWLVVFPEGCGWNSWTEPQNDSIQYSLGENWCNQIKWTSAYYQVQDTKSAPRETFDKKGIQEIQIFLKQVILQQKAVLVHIKHRIIECLLWT